MIIMSRIEVHFYIEHSNGHLQGNRCWNHICHSQVLTLRISQLEADTFVSKLIEMLHLNQLISMEENVLYIFKFKLATKQ